jgi:ABC-type sugar transport system permease subunit
LLGQVFVAVLFSVLFIPQYGLLNQALHAIAPRQFALDTKWLSNPNLVMPALVLTALWLYCGFNMIYFLAALQAVDRELYEAAMVDGANGWHQFWAVTLPGIRPVAVFVLVTSTIGSFQLFELPYIMLNNSAGPDNAGLTIVMYLYNNGFVTGDLGYASAVGWTLALGMLVISLAQMRLTGAWKGSAE